MGSFSVVSVDVYQVFFCLVQSDPDFRYGSAMLFENSFSLGAGIHEKPQILFPLAHVLEPANVRNINTELRRRCDFEEFLEVNIFKLLPKLNESGGFDVDSLGSTSRNHSSES